MSVIDSRVVEMGFDNTKFGAGVQGTLSMLDKLKASLGMQGASKGLQEINAAAQKFDSSSMEQGVSRIGGAFTALQATAFGALANIGAKISNVALNTAKAFTLDPITAGFSEYELKMGSIQTILANTARHGTKLKDVDAALEELNKYADKTIYNFGDMTKNIGLFTNAGLKLEDSTTMIKGFSNAAAASGTNAEGAAHAAQQLSQGLSAGTITAQDWISLTNVGMGNKNMQLAIVDIAKSMGTFSGTGKSATDATKNFKGSLEGKWLTAGVMSTYLKAMSGDMTDAELAAKGLTKAQIEMLQEQAKTGLESATKVRTFTALMGTLKESVGSGWSETFGIVFGGFDEATIIFTKLNDVIGGFLSSSAKARNDLLTEWKAMGGREAAIDAIVFAFKDLGRVIKPLVSAFREVFPKTTAKQLFDITWAISDFMKSIRLSAVSMGYLKKTFAGLFAILGIGWEVIKALGGFLFDLLGAIFEGDSGILKFTGTIGDFLVALHKSIKEGQGFTNFFDMLFSKIEPIIKGFKRLITFLGDVFAGIDLGGAGAGVGAFISDLLSFGHAAEETGEKVEKAVSPLKRFLDFFFGIAKAVGNFVKPIIDNITGAFENVNYDDVMEALQTGLLAGLVVVIKQLGGVFKGLSIFGGKGEGGPGIIEKIKNGLDGLTGTLSAMQANLKASMLLKIALAVAALAISVVLLAGVDAAGLARATAALTVMFIQLAAAMTVFQKIGTMSSIAKMNLMGAALILMGIAILILVGAVKILSSMGWEELAKGLGSLIVLIGGLILMSRGLDKARGAILRSAFALVIMGGALRILVSVVRTLGEMDLDTMKQGLIGIGALLIGLAIFSRIQKAGKEAVAQAVTILILSLALRALADAVLLFGNMSWEELAKGFAGVAGGLVAIALALKFMPPGSQMLFAALAVGKVAGAFVLVAKAIGMFEKFSWNTIAKGLVSVSVSMGVVAGVLKKMPKIGVAQVVALLGLAYSIKTINESMALLGTMKTEDVGKALGVFVTVMATIVTALNMLKGTAEGAGSIAVVAGSFSLLQGVLSEWGAMSLEEIAKGIGTLAAVLAILTVSLSLLKTEATGAAALALVAGALSLLVPALVTLGAMPVAAIGAALVGLAGMFLILVLGLKLLAPVLPVLMGMAGAIALLGLAVALAGAGLLMFSAGITALALAGGAGVAALVAMISAVAGLIPMVAKQIGLGIVALLTAIADSADALVKAVVKILGALLDAIIKTAPKLGVTLLVLLATALRVITTAIPMMVEAGMKLIVGLLRGIANNIGDVIDAATDVIVNFIDGISRSLPKIIQAGVNLIISYVEGLAKAIRDNSERMGRAGGDLAMAIIEGMVNGIMGGYDAVIDAAKKLASGALDTVKDWLGISSPSKEFMKVGRFVALGFIKGLTGSRTDIQEAAVTMLKGLTDAIIANRDAYKEAAKRREELRGKSRENLKDLATAERALARAQAKGQNTDAERRRIERLTAARKKITAAIEEQRKIMVKSEKENVKLLQARAHMQKNLDDETLRLKKLADQYDRNHAKLEEARTQLEDARKVRDDYNQSLRDQYGEMADISAETHLDEYISSLEKQIVSTQEFTSRIQELRRQGLNDELYKELLAKGPEAMPFIDELLAGGQVKIDQLNILTKNLDRDAGTLADKASSSLYQAGVNAAAGLVAGLEAKEKNITDLMDRIAQSMVTSIKKKLGIKSPSRVFEDLGRQTNQGLVRGLDSTASAVGASASSVGDQAISSLRDSLSNVTKMIGSDVDMNPVIAPVLDLSGVRRDAADIGSILAAKPISLDSAYSRASDASAGYSRNQAAAAEAAVPIAGDTLVFEQNNYSPKALTPAEIYRQTNNQLSRAKGALTK